jgi:peptidylprolyl isomerase
MTSPTTIRRAAVLALVTTFFLAPTLAVGADPTPAASPGAADEKTVTTKSGLRYTDIEVGKGNLPKTGQTVSVKYVIYVNDKKVEASSPDANFEFILGRDQALKAIEEGVSTMKVGGKRKLIAPPHLGYGAEGVEGKVPPNTAMTIDLELFAIR